MLNQIGSQVVGDQYDCIIPIATLAAQCMQKLAELAGCNYLSDLRCALSFRYSLFFALPQILAEDYSVKEWNDAVGYILGTRTSFSSAREAYGFLLHALAESAGPDATS